MSGKYQNVFEGFDENEGKNYINSVNKGDDSIEKKFKPLSCIFENRNEKKKYRIKINSIQKVYARIQLIKEEFDYDYDFDLLLFENKVLKGKYYLYC